jgi:hypothetical protein
MKKLYVIRRQDVFDAIGNNSLPNSGFHHIGSLWVIVELTQQQRNQYKFPISEASPTFTN